MTRQNLEVAFLQALFFKEFIGKPLLTVAPIVTTWKATTSCLPPLSRDAKKSEIHNLRSRDWRGNEKRIPLSLEFAFMMQNHKVVSF
jgi:hypothetical protein